MNEKRRVLIFSTVWPEPSSSAAGVRLMQWVNFYLRAGFRVTLSSPSQWKQKGEWGHIELPSNVDLLPLPLNRSESVEILKQQNFEVVMFDRFILEEQFGHQVYESCPDALILMETEDLHFVRRARESVKEKWLSMTASDSVPLAFYQTDTALRETAALHRCDFNFVVSSFEEKLLAQQFDLGREKVSFLPFLYEDPLVVSSSAWNAGAFQRSCGFCWVGNFRHAPNVDGLRWFRKEIWPGIRAKLPHATVQVWGAYPSAEVMQFHDPSTGFLVKGQAEDLSQVFDGVRVNLAPLRYGAGIKGKILEGFRYGIPVVTTSVGAEGVGLEQLELKSAMTSTADSKRIAESFNEMFENNLAAQFVDRAVLFHENEQQWVAAQSAGKSFMTNVHSLNVHENALKLKIELLLKQKKDGMLPIWFSRILRHEAMNSHRYFSKWIELKER